MASERRIARLESMLLREVSDVIQNRLGDPRMGFVSVTKVELSPDCTSAKISVSVLGGKKEKGKTMSALRHASGFVQREASRAIKLRTMPRITFHLDESIEKSVEICKIIDRAVEKDRQALGESEENEEG